MVELSRILVPVDFSPSSAAVLEVALSLAERCGATCDVLHVMEAGRGAGRGLGAAPPSPPADGAERGPAVAPADGAERGPAVAPAAAPPETEEVEAGRAMDAVLGQVQPQHRTQARSLFLRGPVVETILRTARGYDMLVIGSHGRSALMGLLLGSVAEAVLRRSPCPVLTVRAPHLRRSHAPPPRPLHVTLRDGTAVLLRPITPADKERLQEGLRGLSPESRYRRFMMPLKELSDRQLRQLTEIDYLDHMAWGAELADDPEAPGLGLARYTRLPDEPSVAEAAIAVRDSHQRLGLGTLLLGALARSAATNGVERFRAYVLEDNRPMLRILEGLGAQQCPAEPGLVCMEVPVATDPDGLPNSAAGKVMKAVARQMVPPLAVRFLHADSLKKVTRLFGELLG